MSGGIHSAVALDRESQKLPSGRQIRAARRLLHWTRRALAERSGLQVKVIERAEAGDGVANIPLLYLKKIRTALERGAAALDLKPSADELSHCDRHRG